MYKVNFWNLPVPVETPKKHKPPTKCDLCGKKIEDGDYYYGGYDRLKIYLETCDNMRCHQWLVHKKRGKRINGTTSSS